MQVKSLPGLHIPCGVPEEQVLRLPGPHAQVWSVCEFSVGAQDTRRDFWLMPGRALLPKRPGFVYWAANGSALLVGAPSTLSSEDSSFSGLSVQTECVSRDKLAKLFFFLPQLMCLFEASAQIIALATEYNCQN
jgi:hypothetical protein